MRVMVLVVILASASGCANKHVNRATLVASTLALAIDWRYTRSAAENNWHCGEPLFEVGAARSLIGVHPSTGAVDSYFGIAAIVNIAIWMVMPERYRSVIPAGLVVAQTDSIMHNANSPVANCM